MSGAKIADVEVSAAALAGFMGAGVVAIGADAAAGKLAARAHAAEQQQALAAANERRVREVLARNARIAALAEAVVAADTSITLPTPFDFANPPRDVGEWLERIDRRLDVVDAELTTALGTGSGIAINASGDLVADVRVDRSATINTDVHADVRRLLGRLSSDVTATELAPALTAAQLALSASRSDADTYLNELRIRVKHANTQAADRQQRHVAGALANAERTVIREAVTRTLADLGYEVRAGFETLTARDGEVYVTRDDWPDHAVKVRIDDHQLRVAMVRTSEPTSAEDRRRDAEREDEWCESFAELRQRLAGAGMATTVSWSVDHMTLPVVKTSAAKRRSDTAQRQRERER